jgi:ArsR family transcriptional regulator, arsenate/arsenite/antimonite-responsive transcriptional repressor
MIVNMQPNEFITVYTCLCNLARLRILALLLDGPLCVCHIQSILGLPQPKVSRQLNLMKKYGILTSEREYNWSIYRISSEPSAVLLNSLKCLQDARNEMPVFRRDHAKRREVIDQLLKSKDCCPAAVVRPNASRNLKPGAPIPIDPISAPSGRKRVIKNQIQTC